MDSNKLDVAVQEYLPGTEKTIDGQMSEEGISFKLGRDLPDKIEANIEGFCKRLIGSSFYFYIEGPAILNKVEERFGLRKEKLHCSRKALMDYGNASSNTIVYVMDYMRDKMKKKGAEGEESGALSSPFVLALHSKAL